MYLDLSINLFFDYMTSHYYFDFDEIWRVISLHFAHYTLCKRAAAPTTLSILDAVQRKAIRLIGDPALTCHLQPLSHRRGVLLVTSHFSTVIQTDSAPPS
nr:unnamed protein product [Callosobruchus chinensis]